jgi:hypothetical protein
MMVLRGQHMYRPHNRKAIATAGFPPAQDSSGAAVEKVNEG